MSHPVILSIDPGASGGIAWLDNDQAFAVPMPSTDVDAIEVLRSAGRLRDARGAGTAYVEQLVKHMGDGVPSSTMAVYASNWGILMGALMMAKWRIILVRPQEWQKELGLGITGRQKASVDGMSPTAAKAEKKRVALINSRLKTEWKQKLRGEAQRRFPKIDVTLKTSDALLILEYGRTQQ